MNSEISVRMVLLNNPLTIKVLRAVHGLGLPDWAIGAGFVRNQVWDYQHQRKPNEKFNDVDVVYFDPQNTSTEVEAAAEKKLKELFPDISWEVRNQARMHDYNRCDPYTSTADGLAHWTETVTALGITMDDNNNVRIIAPHGYDDLANMIIRPTPYFLQHDPERVLQRVREKQWLEKWPNLTLVMESA
ncbi:MAG: nucleotidyltransferase family protein [Bdellovibrionales bacterium]